MSDPNPTDPASAAPGADSAAAPDATRPIDFSTFLVSLGTSALVQLGEAPDPTDPQAARCCDLEAAKQSIDLLGILEEKTKGNLSEFEERLLGNLLADLRLRYVQCRAGKKGAGT